LITAVACICAAAVWSVSWYRARNLTAPALMKRLPTSGAVVVFVDFAALRQAHILDFLDDPKITQEPEYQEFVRKSGFDYKEDLDAAFVAFAPSGKYMLLRGRFDWKSLRSYAGAQGGRCYNSLCRMQGSTPDRRISYFPVQSNLMALAVGEDESAALRMQSAGDEAPAEVPNGPVWISLPPSALSARQDLPEGTRPFARSMERAQSIALSFVPEENHLAAKLNVRCRNAQEASTLAGELSRTTTLLNQMIEREHQKPNPADFSGVLTSGSFRSDGSRVFGYWRIERAFIENMLGGQG
jgi:hypothetical protein